RDHAALERAGRRGLVASVRADDPRVERASVRALHLVDPLERGDHVLGGDRLAVRELDPLAEMEHPLLAAVRRRRQVRGAVRYDVEGGAAAGVLEREEPVVGGLEELPVLEGVVDLWIDGAGGRLREELERAAAVVLDSGGVGSLLRGGAEAVAG